MKEKKYFILTTVLLTLGIVGLILLNSKLNNEETVLDEVKLKENKVDKKSFAIMIQKEDKTGYEVYEESSWPTNAIYNNELSGCIDNYGSIIENSLSYNQETNKVTINTGVTSSCYLYFDLDKEAPIVSAIVNNNNSTNATITISSNETGKYCVNTSSTITDMSNCVFNGNITKDVSVTTSIFSTGGDYYVHIKDNAGNIGISGKVTVTLAQEIGEYLLQNPSTGLNISTAYGGMYRYIGITANNYVKLGDVLYRIIGVTTATDRNTELGIEANQLKLIQVGVGGVYYWDNNYSDVKWENSGIYTYLQSNSVLGNTSVIPSDWVNKVSGIKWNAGDVQIKIDMVADSIVLDENVEKTSKTIKIGLMYLSDYFYAYNNGGTNNCWSSSCQSWLTDTSNTIWTLTRYGKDSTGNFFAWATKPNGKVDYEYLSSMFIMRYVFYLNKDVYITNPEATGTSSDPFILSY